MVCEAESDSANALLRGGGISILPLFLFFLFLFPQKVFAQIVINEFQVKPDQWIELYNKSEGSVDISGWIIDDEGGTEKYIISSGIILPSKRCVTFPSGKFNWNTTSGDTVRLLDTNSNPKEEYTYSSAPGEGISIGRVIDGEGDLVVLLSSSRDKSNITGESCFVPISTPTPTLTLTPTEIPATATPIPTNTPAPNSYSKIFISEFMADPESGNEWVELFNDNDSEVNLNGWYLDDISGGGKSPRGISGTISANSYKQFFLDDFFFNNSGDDVRLLDGSQTEKDKKSYSSSTKGKSWSKDSSGNWCQLDPTPNQSNNNCPATNTPTLSPTLTPTKTPTPSVRLTVTPTAEPTLAEQDPFNQETGNQQVLGVQISPTVIPPKTAKASIKITAGILILGGLILLGTSGFLLYRQKM